MLSGALDLAGMSDYAVDKNIAPVRKSGRQEYLENYVTKFTK